MSEIDRSIIGRKFGKLTVMDFDHMGKRGSYWLCQCDCGGTRIASRAALRTGETTHCGDCHPNVKDLTGERFGKLTVLYLDHIDGTRGSYWLCKCDCGNETVVSRNALITAHTKSCGCYYTETHTKHGMTDTRLFNIWSMMRSRCRNKTGDHHRWYADRGITVCPEWEDFETFRDWALDNGYRDDLTIDRINNDLGYFPENCRWVDRSVQANNRTTTRLVTYNGETHSAKEWSRIFGVNYTGLLYRLNTGNMRDFEEYFKE